jgi:hypothetical protein
LVKAVTISAKYEPDARSRVDCSRRRDVADLHSDIRECEKMVARQRNQQKRHVLHEGAEETMLAHRRRIAPIDGRLAPDTVNSSSGT